MLITLMVGAAAGLLGSVLGIGGGVFLVPVLNKVLALPFLAAAAVSLVSVDWHVDRRVDSSRHPAAAESAPGDRAPASRRSSAR